jgi:hypothetical protein
MLLGAFLFLVAKGLPNVGAVQVGNLDVTLKDVHVEKLQCCVTVDATQILLVTINKCYNNSFVNNIESLSLNTLDEI